MRGREFLAFSAKSLHAYRWAALRRSYEHHETLRRVDAFMTENNGADSQQFARNIPLLRDLRAASNPPVYVNRDTKLSEALTKMMMNDFSQLPIIQGERTVEGYISWRTIGEALALKRECNTVRDCMEKSVTILDDTEPLLNAVNVIAKKDFILVRNSKDKRIVGLVTTSGGSGVGGSGLAIEHVIARSPARDCHSDASVLDLTPSPQAPFSGQL